MAFWWVDHLLNYGILNMISPSIDKLTILPCGTIVKLNHSEIVQWFDHSWDYGLMVKHIRLRSAWLGPPSNCQVLLRAGSGPGVPLGPQLIIQRTCLDWMTSSVCVYYENLYTCVLVCVCARSPVCLTGSHNGNRHAFINRYPLIWVNYNDLTATSL